MSFGLFFSASQKKKNIYIYTIYIKSVTQLTQSFYLLFLQLRCFTLQLKIVLFSFYTESLSFLPAAPYTQLKLEQPPKETRYTRQNVIQNTSVLKKTKKQKHFRGCGSFMGCTAMNQNLNGQSESSSSSCGFLINNKQCCVASRDLHKEFAQARTGAACCPPGSCGRRQPGIPDPSREGNVSFCCVTHADLLLSQRFPTWKY